MARRYAIATNFATGTAAQDLLRVTVPDNGVTRLVEAHVTNEADETSEQLPFLISRATTAGAGTIAAIINLDPGDAAIGASGSAISDLSTPVTQGDAIYREAVNILAGFHYVPLPDSRPAISAGGAFMIRMDTGPTNAQTLSVSVVIEVEG